jgi:hypothetical protein
MTTNSAWAPYNEPLRQTLFRTLAIAAAIGAVRALSSGQWSAWSHGSLLALWFSFGGHFVELWFLNWLRFRIPPSRRLQVAARLLTWFVGGCLLLLGMKLTAAVLFSPLPPLWRNWWLGGLGFIGIELVVHSFLWFRGLQCFYDGRG